MTSIEYILQAHDRDTNEYRGIYTGRAGNGFISMNDKMAFLMTKQYATTKAEQLNRMSSLHKMTFTVKEITAR